MNCLRLRWQTYIAPTTKPLVCFRNTLPFQDPEGTSSSLSEPIKQKTLVICFLDTSSPISNLPSSQIFTYEGAALPYLLLILIIIYRPLRVSGAE